MFLAERSWFVAERSCGAGTKLRPLSYIDLKCARGSSVKRIDRNVQGPNERLVCATPPSSVSLTPADVRYWLLSKEPSEARQVRRVRAMSCGSRDLTPHVGIGIEAVQHQISAASQTLVLARREVVPIDGAICFKAG